MTKRSRFYQIGFIIASCVCVCLLAYMGITAVQKSMRLKLGFNAEPNIYCYIEYKLSSEADSAYKPLFCNVTNTGAGLEPNVTANATLSGNTLTLTNTFEALGASFDFRIYNYNNFNLAVTCAELSKNTTANSSAPNVASNAKPIVFTSITTGGGDIVFSFEQFTRSTLKTGLEVNTAIGTSATSVVFGYWSDYESEVSQTWDENETDLSVEENDDSIKIFSGKTDSNAKYILSKNRIFANADCSNMFYICTEIESLHFGNFYTDDVTTMRSMFAMYNSGSRISAPISSLDLSSFNTSNVIEMYSMFLGCENLTSLDLSSFDTSKVTDMKTMFYSCSSLKTLDVSNFDTSIVTDMEGMFNGCSSIETLDLGNFDTSNVSNMRDMFAYCSNLTSLELSSFDTSNVTNMSLMFNSCSNLTTIYVSDKWSTASVTSSNAMFTACTSLVGGDGVTKVTSTNKTNAHYNAGGYLTYKAATS